MLGSCGSDSTALHPNPQHNICMSSDSATGRWILTFCLWNALNCLRDEILLWQTQVFWRSFPGLCSCRTVVVVTAVDAEPVCLQQFAILAANSAACDICGREVVWCLYSKLIFSGTVSWSFSLWAWIYIPTDTAVTNYFLEMFIFQMRPLWNDSSDQKQNGFLKPLSQDHWLPKKENLAQPKLDPVKLATRISNRSVWRRKYENDSFCPCNLWDYRETDWWQRAEFM